MIVIFVEKVIYLIVVDYIKEGFAKITEKMLLKEMSFQLKYMKKKQIIYLLMVMDYVEKINLIHIKISVLIATIKTLE